LFNQIVQAVEIKSLRSELETLSKTKNRNCTQKDLERQSFRWLFENISGDEKEDGLAPHPSFPKRRRPRKLPPGGGWVSDDDLDDELEEEDGALTDDAVSNSVIALYACSDCFDPQSTPLVKYLSKKKTCSLIGISWTNICCSKKKSVLVAISHIRVPPNPNKRAPRNFRHSKPFFTPAQMQPCPSFHVRAYDT
jgi:hypothetical protein